MSEAVILSIAFAGAAAISAVAVPVVIRLSHRLGVLDLPGARKVHKSPTPRLGGLAIAAAVVLASIAAYFLGGSVSPVHALTASRFAVVLASAAFLLLVGFADDLFDIPSQFKLIALLAAAAAVCGSGLLIDTIGFGGSAALPLGMFAWPLTILWIAGITVSINFIDGLDGLAGGIVGIAATALSATAALHGDLALACLGLALAGALCGFLLYNFNPAKVFMGDSGSMFVGFLLACLGVCGASQLGTRGGIILPSVILCIPLIDTTLTFIRRGVLHRRSIFSAERGHIHHRLIDMGLCQRHAVLLLYGVTAAAAAVGLAGLYGGRWALVGGLTFLSIVLAALFRTTGSTRARETVAAIRRNRAIARETGRDRKAFEEMQVRFEAVHAFNDWWENLCAAAGLLGIARLSTHLTNRDGSPRRLIWNAAARQGSPQAQHDPAVNGAADALWHPVAAQLPVRQRRVGGPLLIEVRMPPCPSAETSMRRIMFLSRLVDEHSIAALPDAVEQPPVTFLPNAGQRGAGNGNLKTAPLAPAARAVRDLLSMETIEALRREKTLPLRQVRQTHRGQAQGRPPRHERQPRCGQVQDGPPGQVDGQRCRIAVVHDFLYTYGGAERVLEQILAVFPQAEVFSLFDFLPAAQRGFLGGRSVRTSFIQKLPLARRKHRLYLPLMPLAVEQLDVSAYDVVISSSYIVAKGVITRPGQLHICYCHSPVRFAWDLQGQYLSEAGIASGIKSALARVLLHYIRNYDVRSASGVDLFLTNSRFVSQRVEKYYRRRSTPIYPPIDIDHYNPAPFDAPAEHEDYFLTASRLVPYKRIDVVIRAFNRMPGHRLIVVGDGPELHRLQALAGPNVRLVGRVSGERLKGYLRRARAFVFAAEEDFGIAPVEAQACGTPVIAYGRGGALESVVEGRTGLFFPEQTADSLISAVQRFEAMEWDASLIRRNAERFSAERFRGEFRNFVESEWAAHRARLADSASADWLAADATASAAAGAGAEPGPATDGPAPDAEEALMAG